MTDLIPTLQTTLSGANLAILLLVLYRVTNLEKEVSDVRDKLSDTREKVVALDAVKER